jgi:bisphosphoglycerate-dependent phosphoglycerate mutase
MSKHRLLEIAEYISIFAVLGGSTIAVASGQIIYATVPMALAILLNLIRRYQFKEQLCQQVNRNNNETYQQILSNIQSLTKLAISSQNTSEAIQHNITTLSEMINFLQTDNNSQSINENITELKIQYHELQDTFSRSQTFFQKAIANRLISINKCYILLNI